MEPYRRDHADEPLRDPETGQVVDPDGVDDGRTTEEKDERVAGEHGLGTHEEQGRDEYGTTVHGTHEYGTTEHGSAEHTGDGTDEYGSSEHTEHGRSEYGSTERSGGEYGDGGLGRRDTGGDGFGSDAEPAVGTGEDVLGTPDPDHDAGQADSSESSNSDERVTQDGPGERTDLIEYPEEADYPTQTEASEVTTGVPDLEPEPVFGTSESGTSDGDRLTGDHERATSHDSLTGDGEGDTGHGDRPGGDGESSTGEGGLVTSEPATSEHVTSEESESVTSEPLGGEGESLDSEVVPVGGEPVVVGAPGTVGAGEPGAGVGADSKAVPGGEPIDYQQRWREVQAGFVDDPRDAVERADQLVEEAVTALTTRRQALTDRWKNSDQGDTEQLRLALREYRSLLEELVGLSYTTPGQANLPAQHEAR